MKNTSLWVKEYYVVLFFLRGSYEPQRDRQKVPVVLNSRERKKKKKSFKCKHKKVSDILVNAICIVWKRLETSYIRRSKNSLNKINTQSSLSQKRREESHSKRWGN